MLPVQSSDAACPLLTGSKLSPSWQVSGGDGSLLTRDSPLRHPSSIVKTVQPDVLCGGTLSRQSPLFGVSVSGLVGSSSADFSEAFWLDVSASDVCVMNAVGASCWQSETASVSTTWFWASGAFCSAASVSVEPSTPARTNKFLYRWLVTDEWNISTEYSPSSPGESGDSPCWEYGARASLPPITTNTFNKSKIFSSLAKLCFVNP